MNVLPHAVELQSDTSPANWVAEQLRKAEESAWPVASVVPDGFGSYTRIQHEHEGDPSQVQGTIPAEQLTLLTPVLTEFTTTPESCWYAVWEGEGHWYYGSAHTIYGLSPKETENELARLDAISRERDRIMRAAAKFTALRLDYFLFRGPIGAAGSLGVAGWMHKTANFWWPDDRAWCVGTNIELPETYIGGNQALTDRLLGTSGLNASRVDPHQDLRKLIPKY